MQALRLPDESVLSPDPLAGYKRAVADFNPDLSFSGLGLPAADPKSIEDVYVSVKVTPVRERNREDDWLFFCRCVERCRPRTRING